MNQQQPEVQSYIETEFFFYMLTCYYAIVAYSLRYYEIMKEPPEINAPPLPAEGIVTCLESQSQTVPGLEAEEPPASYSLKTKLCLVNSFMYLFMAIFTFVGTSDMFYACNNKRFGVIYVFGFIAWFMGAIVLRRQYQRKLPQSLRTHRIVWIFSAAFAITKMFQDYLLLFNLVLNTISIITNVILAAYAIYRPEDTDTIQLIHNEQIPGFMKMFFEYIELSPIIRKIFMIKQRSLKRVQKLQGDEIDELDMKYLDESLKITNKSRREEINLLNTLPRRNIFIDKKLQYVKSPNGNVSAKYFILTQIGNQRFEALRTYEEFQRVQKELVQFFSEKNFPKLLFPKIKAPEEGELGNRSTVLEDWLGEIIKKPIFMIKPLLEFLEVDQNSASPFATYFDYSFRSFCSRSFMLSQIKKKQEERTSLIGYYEDQRKTVKIASLIKENLEYIVEVDKDITGSNDYGFLMTCIRKDKKNERINWKIKKNIEQITSLNQRIEEECKLSVPFYYQMLTSLGSKNTWATKQGFKNYLIKLLQDDKYYCPNLFQFIRFDPINVQVAMQGTKIQINANLTEDDKRNSHYFEEYEPNNQDLIQILRVDRLDPGSYKFRVQRGQFMFVRLSSEFEDLRMELKQIYEGVSSVPIIQFEEGSKKQIKRKTERFLRGLQVLPKIAINQCYIDFYHNML